jgi:putative oxidoreductase
LNIALWIAQVLLGVAFAMAGFMKLVSPIDELARNMSWVYEARALVRFIGAAELLGALGLVLPSAMRIKPWLTPLAAVGLGVVMVLAMGFHATRGELETLPVNVALGGIAAFIAWGRWKKAPIPPR